MLGVKLSLDAEISSPPSTIPTDKVLRRDRFSCRFCDFQSRKYQRVVPHARAGSPPFATACIFCEQCLCLERTGTTGAGVLIWLPEITQAALNHIVRAIYIGRLEGKKTPQIPELATRALDALTARRADAKKRLGSDDPMLLATLLYESLTQDERQQAVAKLDGIRLLPSDKYLVRSSKGDVDHFPRMAKYWCSPEGPYGHMPVAQWADLFKKAVDGVGHA